MTSRPLRIAPRGFTLTEVAVVVAIVALLIGGTLMTLAAQNAAREVNDTRRTLELARDAIVGFVIQNGRLPCPAFAGGIGREAFVNPATDRSCSVPLNGVVPALDLGIGPTNGAGHLVDAWGNAIRYSVSQWVANPPAAPVSCPPNAGPIDFTKCPAFTTADAMKALGFGTLPTTFPNLLRVCDAAACGGQQFFTPAVLYSTGKNFSNQALAGAAGGVDEEANINFAGVPHNGTFVSHEPRPAGAPGNEYDDIVIWVSPNVLYNRMIAAGAI